MIYTILPEKDTYITNRVINSFNCNKSNVGKAATLDIFKLNNENDDVKSWAILNILETLPTNGETFTLTDSKGNQVVFKFVSGQDNGTPGETVSGEDNIKIGLGSTPFTSSQLTLQIKNIVNAVSSVTQTGPSGNLTLEITALSSSTTILLEQNNKGESGDKQITQSSSPNLLVKKNFGRLEYSNILIKFDLAKFKTDNISNFSNSVFSNKSNFKAELELIDISLGHSKPYDYSLTLFPLSKSFDEGLGKDTISFEDIDSCNFVTSSLNKTTGIYNTWGINNLLVENIDFYQNNNGTSLTANFNVEKGDENIKLDITEYLHQFLSNNINDNGFSIRLGDTSLFDESSYFVKRLGSKHLLNKKYIPRLNIEINDSSYYLPKNNTDISRYYNSSHDFYLYNKQGGLLKDVPVPTGLSNNNFSASLKYNDFELIKKGLGSSEDITKYTNLFGAELNGIYKFTVADNEVSRFDQFLSESIEGSTSGSIDFDLEWHWFKSGEIPEKRIIKTEKVKFNLPENEDFTTKNIISKITVNNFELIGNDTIQNLSIFFIDTKKQYEANKKPYDIKCENLGNVHIRILDTHDNTILIDYDKDMNSTKLFFNGKDFDYNFFVSSMLKNKTIGFEFVIIDEITNTTKIIKDNTKIKVL